MSSPPPLLPFFDPAFDLHSDQPNKPILPPSESNSDDLEALHVQQQEITRAKTEAGVVIQHRLHQYNEPLHSDEIFNPETPSRTVVNPPPAEDVLPDSSPEQVKLPKLPLASSPVLYPPSSSPVVSRKRKLFQSLDTECTKKRKWPTEYTRDDVIGTKIGAQDALQKRGTETSQDSFKTTVFEDVESGVLNNEDSRQAASVAATRGQQQRGTTNLSTCSGKQFNIPLRTKSAALTYEQAVAQRSITGAGRAKKAYFGIEIHQLLDDAACQKTIDEAEAEVRVQRMSALASIEVPTNLPKPTDVNSKQMWTEKYRARKFTDLVGDERTHRAVLRWLKGWDALVFPGSSKAHPKKAFSPDKSGEERRQNRKILLLTGPPGLGKTTLAHVCAKQAGYEVLEINASDDRSRDVVKGRIKDALGTETVRGMTAGDKTRKTARPVCVVVDEVDGVVSGSSGSGGEGGFTKALIDLVQLDQRNQAFRGGEQVDNRGKKGKEARFRLMRPLILICNDVYAPSLRPLRTSSAAEIIHVRKPPLDKIITRVRHIFEKEEIPSDADAIRRLCESAWGLTSRKQGGSGKHGAGEGDLRRILVQGEWVARKLRATSVVQLKPRLTKTWLDEHVSSNDSQAGGLGRGGTREVVDRVFLEGAGLPNLPTKLSTEDARLLSETKANPLGVADLRKRAAVTCLRELADTCGEHDRLMTDCFAAYPSQVFQDDTRLSKPNAGYDWLCFHDRISSRVYSGQEWELKPYLSTGVCAFHHLFAAVDKGARGWDADKMNDDEDGEDAHPFSGPKADFMAFEAEKQKRALLTEFQASFSAPLLRLFRSVDSLSVELVPSLARMLAPDVKPVVVGGSGGLASVASVRKESERNCIRNAVRVMGGLNVSFEKTRVEIESGGAHSNGGFVYRMEPPLDTLTSFTMGRPSGTAPAPVRYAVRQVLDHESRAATLLRQSTARRARSTPLHVDPDAVAGGEEEEEHDKENSGPPQRSKAPTRGPPRDFFGRVIVNDARWPPAPSPAATAAAAVAERVWVSFHEGYSNAVRKPVSLRELLDSF